MKNSIEEIDKILFSDKYSVEYKGNGKKIWLKRTRFVFINEFINYLYQRIIENRNSNPPVLDINGCYTWLSFYYLRSFIHRDFKKDRLSLVAKPHFFFWPDIDEAPHPYQIRHFIFTLLNYKDMYRDVKILFCESPQNYKRGINWINGTSENNTDPYLVWGDIREPIFFREQIYKNHELLRVFDDLYIENKNGIYVHKIGTNDRNKKTSEMVLKEEHRLGILERFTKTGGSLFKQISEKFLLDQMTKEEIRNILPEREYSEKNFLKDYYDIFKNEDNKGN